MFAYDGPNVGENDAPYIIEYKTQATRNQVEL